MIAIPPSLMEEWELIPDGSPVERPGSTYTPVRTVSGARASLKIGPRSAETGQEHLVLQRWGGRSAPLLLRADPHRSALLLQRLTMDDLTHLEDVEACE